MKSWPNSDNHDYTRGHHGVIVTQQGHTHGHHGPTMTTKVTCMATMVSVIHIRTAHKYHQTRLSMLMHPHKIYMYIANRLCSDNLHACPS